MKRLALLTLCMAVSCTQAPVQEPQPAAVPADGAQVVPIQADGPQAVAIDAPAPARPDDLQSYAMAVSRAIRARLVLPSKLPATASAVYEITLLENGAVAKLRAVKRSGFPAYDAAIRRAIERAQPYPPLAGADAAEPIRIRLTFRAKE